MSALFVLLALIGGAQAAQPPADPVVGHLNSAQASMAAGNYEAALRELEAARKLGGRPAIVALNLAKAHAHLKDPDAAFREFVRHSSASARCRRPLRPTPTSPR